MSLASLTSGYSATLQKPTVSQDTSGGPVREPFVDVLTGIACDLQPAGSTTVLAYAQRQIRVTHQVYLTRDVAAKTGWRFLFAGKKYVVKGYQNEAGRSRLWVADVEEQL